MQCDLCGKMAATVHLTEIIGDSTRELHLCEPCAREKGVKVEGVFGLADGKTIAPCPQCGMRFEEFKRSGRLGCGACYGAFKEQIGPLLKQVHGADRHVGRTPKAATLESRRQAELETLKAKLKQAVKSEAFEEAAQMRDQIAMLEKGLKKGTTRVQRNRRT
ncbi:MAG: UvrB/UvrC motif-containing protein [Candidatus Omnitrophica bacterium]|nr:UvrB/UvrC motif-containing protein [Candidatus Omnitrophota bacterium]